MRTLVLAGFLAIVAQLASATEIEFDSGEGQVGLLELYTSEGCSSCPPADRWLSKLTSHEQLWHKFVPIGLHVDYWDYIGWKDRFASPRFSRRQRDYARHNKVSTVYTPGFVYNGREWRRWFGQPSTDFPQGSRPGNLIVSVNDRKATLRFLPLFGEPMRFDASVALLGFGISTDVEAGENSGRRLTHDFVVLGLKQQRLTLRDGEHRGSISLPPEQIAAERYALAAWVSTDNLPVPIQAVGGWLPKGL